MAHVANLTIDSTKVPSNLTDFPVYVDLSDMNADFWNTVANGGGDIRVFKSDGTTELPREVVSCDTGTETGELHFKYTGTLSSSTDTDVQIHADGTSSDYATDATYGAENVWSDYKGSYRLQNNATDSSGNNNGTASGLTDTTGKLGDGYEFGGSSDEIDLGTVNGFDISSSNYTISLWAKTNNSPSEDKYIITSREATSTNETVFWIRQKTTNSGGDLLFTHAELAAAGVGVNTTTGFNDNSYHLIHMVKTSGRIDVYIDGSSEGSNTGTTGNLTTSQKIRIGDYESSTQDFEGDIDEVRIRPSALSADWISAEYNNQNSPSTFYTVTDALITVSLTDTMALSESTTLPRSLLFSHTDTLDLSESTSALKVLFVNIVDTLNLSESVSGIRSRISSIVDSLGLSEWVRTKKPITNRTKNTATGISNRVKNDASVTNRSKS